MSMRPRIITTILTGTAALLLATGCAGAASSPEESAAFSTAEANAGSLELTSDFSTTEMLDTRSGGVVDLGQVVTGDRPVLLWYWAPT